MKTTLRRCTDPLALLVLTCLLAGPCLAQEDNQPPEGFYALFNGVDLDNWGGGSTRDPAEYSEMSSEEYWAWRERMDVEVPQHWRVEDGELISDGRGPNLVSWFDYADFEMWVDWKIQPGGDSGIYLRHCPQVQIWDPSNPDAQRHGADKGSGGLWNNQTHERFPSEVADNPTGQWNRMYIRMVGPYVTVILNGKKIVDNVVLENYYHRDQPVYQEGPVHLQTHGSETRFRNVFVRRMPTEESDALLNEITGGDADYTPLFNGTDFTGWMGDTDSYEVVDGAIRCRQDYAGNLITEREYDNFIVRLEFMTPPGGNNGLAIRTPDAEANPADDALELQVLDNNHIMYAELHDYQYHGSAYGISPALRGYLRPACQWNYEQVTVNGDHVIVELNGFKILDVHLREAAPDHPAASRTTGHFGFTGHGDPVSFRNIRILEIDE